METYDAYLEKIEAQLAHYEAELGKFKTLLYEKRKGAKLNLAQKVNSLESRLQEVRDKFADFKSAGQDVQLRLSRELDTLFSLIQKDLSLASGLV